MQCFFGKLLLFEAKYGMLTPVMSFLMRLSLEIVFKCIISDERHELFVHLRVGKTRSLILKNLAHALRFGGIAVEADRQDF